MLKTITLLIFVLAAAQAELLVVEKRDKPPDGFSRIGPSPADKVLTLRLALAHNDITGLHDTVYDVSTPGNPRYGQYLSKEKVEKFVAPSQDTIAQVQSWLGLNNLTSSPLTPAGDWIAVNMTVAQANRILTAEFSTFQNEETNHTVDRTLSYSIPSTLKSGINVIYPTVTFPVGVNTLDSVVNATATKSGANPPTASISPDCQVSWTPACVQQLYNIPSEPAQPAPNVLAVSGFSNEFANKRDLKAFLEEFRPDMNPNTTFDLISIDGGINNQLPAGAGVFGGIDTQYTIGLATGVPVAYISTGPLDSDDALAAFLEQANYLVSSANPPQTIVNNFGGLESEVSPQIAESLCNAYAQLAARGVSYIVNTGVGGAGGTPFVECIPFDPPFPASCPFVTAVGGTEFTSDETTETASALSGGGFSNVFKRPKYQDAAVTAYLRTIGADGSSPFNVSGRAVPDVSALSSAIWVIDGGTVDFAGIPAFSADIFASVVALITNERIAAGKSGLGFLNPLIYQNGAAFNDMPTGSNPGCGDAVFNATEGWDPVTGFGSPNYTKLRNVCNKF
ncbi:subtilisin-like protein [Mycena olivaceomarginata]|nr:subtilisin-like protein [Mycena olivaceomarginata]